MLTVYGSLLQEKCAVHVLQVKIKVWKSSFHNKRDFEIKRYLRVTLWSFDHLWCNGAFKKQIVICLFSWHMYNTDTPIEMCLGAIVAMVQTTASSMLEYGEAYDTIAS